MPLSLRDVRYSVRRSARAERELYPRLLRDRSWLPKTDIAIQYFESMLGHERRDFESDTLVHFFGDHRVARAMIACLARSYRFRARRFDEVVGARATRRLARASLDSSLALRLRLFDHLNDSGHGFLASDERAATLGRIGAELGLRAGDLEQLLFLDSDERAILVRLGAPPDRHDVLAEYNFSVLLALLRQAVQVELVLANRSAATLAGLAAVARVSEVDLATAAEGAKARVVLFGRQDALGVWSRHGRRVARAVVRMLERARPLALEGQALVDLRERRATLRLTPELLDVLGGAPAPCTGWDDRPADELAWLAGPAISRSAPRGWSLRRAPEPQGWSRGVVVPDLLVRSQAGEALITVVRSAAHAARLAPLAASARTGPRLVFCGEPITLAPLAAVDTATIALPRPDSAQLFERLGQLLGGEGVVASSTGRG